MSVSIQDIINQALENRAIALSSLSASLKEKESKEEELGFYYKYLFGDGGNNLGVINILEIYYKELDISVGRTTSRPALQGGINSSKNLWISAFDNAIKFQGDDANGFYPPDTQTNIGDLNFNTGSNFLTTNGDNGETQGGIVVDILNAIEKIGEEASQNDNSRGSFNTESEAEELRDETKGSGILGKRTENSEVFNDGTEEEPEWKVGKNGIDNPHWYNDGKDFENALQSIINELEIYETHIGSIKSYLEFIENGEHAQFEEAGMSENMPIDDINRITTLENNIQNFISDLQEELEYFSSFTASDDISNQPNYNENVFNNKLQNTVPNLLNSIRTTLQSRANVVGTNIDFNNTEGSFRKWLVFWIKQAIGKFDGALVTINGIRDNTIPNAEKSLENANEAIETLFGDDFTRFLIRPEVFAAFYNPEIDEETGEVISKNTGLIWSANLAANRYNIYRRNVTTSTSLLSNDTQWQESDRIKQFVDLNEAETMVRSDYTDKNVSSGIYVYRVKSFDTNELPKAKDRLDTVLNKNTSSPQSDVVGKTYTIESVSENKIKLTENISNPFGVCFISNKYYAVQKAKNNEVVLFESAPLNASKLEEIIGGVFVPE